jgi:hypothetical protein
MAQTSRELIGALYHSQNPERVGFRDGPWVDTICAWVQQGYPTRVVHKEAGDISWRRSDGRWEDVTVEGDYEEPVPVWEHLHYDMAQAGPVFDFLPLRGYDELIEETDEWDVRRNGAGASLKYWKHKSGTPEHIDFRMTSRDIWEHDYRPSLLRWDAERVNLLRMHSTWADVSRLPVWKTFGSMFVWENMRRSMGDVTLYESLITDPEWIHDYNRVHVDMFKKYYAYMFEQVGLPDGVWLNEDLGYKNGLFARPSMLGDLIFPYYAEMVSFFHGYGLPVTLHSCGSVAEAMPMIVQAGFDALHPMERKAKDNEPFVFAEKYGDKLLFIGGFDVRIFETNDKDLIRREMAAYIDGMKARGARLVFGSDHSVPPTVHYDTYRHIYDVYQEHCWY